MLNKVWDSRVYLKEVATHIQTFKEIQRFKVHKKKKKNEILYVIMIYLTNNHPFFHVLN